MQAHPKVFAPAAGGWGKGGSTSIRLQAANRSVVRDALGVAWRRRVPKRLQSRTP